MQVSVASQCPIGNITDNWPVVFKVMSQYGLADRLNLIAAIGTIAHETAHTFKPIHEYGTPADWARYSGGAAYAGRGYIQLTHDYNYKTYGDKIGIDLLNNPDLALQPDIAAKVLCEYWISHNMTALAQSKDWAGIRRAVYGGNDPVGTKVIQGVYDSLYTV